ncbi:hypothetical protein HDE77_000390 [Rhodanobacter sp. MP7CTX1]|nr:hypothetical protein [Rhodanobacter sp. MP7CTX1]
MDVQPSAESSAVAHGRCGSGAFRASSGTTFVCELKNNLTPIVALPYQGGVIAHA